MTTITFDFNSTTYTLTSTVVFNDNFDQLSESQQVTMYMSPALTADGFAIPQALSFTHQSNIKQLVSTFSMPNGGQLRLNSSSISTVNPNWLPSIIHGSIYDSVSETWTTITGLGISSAIAITLTNGASANGDPFITPLLV